MTHVSAADVAELARALCRGDKSREEVSRTAMQIIEDAENNRLTAEDSAFELLTYLVLIDGGAPGRRYLFTDEEVREELAKLGVS